jgi:HD-like signal output (HDOD) protein
LVKALGIIKDDNSGTKELSEIMAYDQALTSQVLKLVNSAYYGFAQEITSVSKALALLGMTQTRNIIIAVAMKPMLTSQGGREMWKHSLQCGVACEHIAETTGIIDPGDAFTIGFLHDVGKILLNILDTVEYQKVRAAVKSGIDIIEAENEAFETNHADLGFLLAKKWKLPVLLANCIKYHHDPMTSSMPQASALAYTGNKISHDRPDEIDENIIKEQLGLDINQITKIRTIVLEKSSSLIASLNA